MISKDSPTIIKHNSPIPLDDCGAILRPFDANNSLTGGGWFSRFKEDLFSMYFIPLKDISQNPWTSLEKLGINCAMFKDLVSYECPFTEYKHYWFIPIFLFSNNISEWLAKVRLPFTETYLNKEWMNHSYSQDKEKGIKFTKVQRTLLGSGYTVGTLPSDGFGKLFDAYICINNGDFLGGKVWVWYNR